MEIRRSRSWSVSLRTGRDGPGIVPDAQRIKRGQSETSQNRINWRETVQTGLVEQRRQEQRRRRQQGRDQHATDRWQIRKEGRDERQKPHADKQGDGIGRPDETDLAGGQVGSCASANNTIPNPFHSHASKIDDVSRRVSFAGIGNDNVALLFWPFSTVAIYAKRVSAVSLSHHTISAMSPQARNRRLTGRYRYARTERNHPFHRGELFAAN